VAQGVVVPNLRYRRDVGERLERGGEWDLLHRLGWLE
jgi:phosphoribosylamine---glycine ligase